MTICLYLLAFIFNKSLYNIFFNSLFLSANTYQVYLYYSSLENPMDGGALQSTGSQESDTTWWLNHHHHHHQVYATCKMLYFISSWVLFFRNQKVHLKKVGGVGKKQFVQNQIQFSRSVVSDSCDPMNCSTPGPPVHHQLPEFTQTHFHWVGDAIQQFHPLSSPSAPALDLSQHQGLFQRVLPIRWPEYWSFSFSISPSSEHPGLISFMMDWLDVLAVQGTLKSLLQHHSSKASIFLCWAFFTVQLSHPYMTTGKIITLTRRTLGFCKTI